MLSLRQMSSRLVATVYLIEVSIKRELTVMSVTKKKTEMIDLPLVLALISGGFASIQSQI